MKQQTIVAIYDTLAHANAAVQELESVGIPSDYISKHSKATMSGSTSSSSATTSGTPVREQGFWSSLFGGEPDHDTSIYDRSVESGSTVVTVKVADNDFDRVSAILEKHDPVDMDERAAGYGVAGAAGTHETVGAAHGVARDKGTGDGGTMQLAEEQMSVGKRAVRGGTTRIRRYSVETPVEEQVSLRSEKVTVDRRPVSDGRPIADANFDDKTIELTESREEAVVSKTARVKEEVSLRKEKTDRTETVKDTVRSDEVEVEKIPEGRTTEGERIETSPDQRRPKI